MDNETPRVAILIPTLNRTHLLKALINNIRETTPEPHEIYFMTSNKESKKVIEENGAVCFNDVGSTDLITRTNALYRLTDEPLIYTGSDDIKFHKNWYPKMLEKIREGYHVVVPQDLLNPNGTQALITREYIQDQSCCIDVPNVVYFPGYKHEYAETEQFEVAKKRGVFARSDAVVEHLHWVNSKNVRDGDYLIGQNNSLGSRELFEERMHLWQ